MAKVNSIQDLNPNSAPRVYVAATPGVDANGDPLKPGIRFSWDPQIADMEARLDEGAWQQLFQVRHLDVPYPALPAATRVDLRRAGPSEMLTVLVKRPGPGDDINLILSDIILTRTQVTQPNVTQPLSGEVQTGKVTYSYGPKDGQNNFHAALVTLNRGGTAVECRVNPGPPPSSGKASETFEDWDQLFTEVPVTIPTQHERAEYGAWNVVMRFGRDWDGPDLEKMIIEVQHPSDVTVSALKIIT
jgi:hypothetical protein